MSWKRGDGSRLLEVALRVVVVAMAVYHLAYSQVILQSPVGHRVTHFGFAMVVVFLSLMRKGRRNSLFDIGLILVSVAATVYFLYSLDQILRFRSAVPTVLDILVGGVCVFLAFVATYRSWGKTFLLVTAASMAYLLLGRYLPRPFKVPPVPLDRIAVWLAIPGTQEGIFGEILAISANYLFLIILFGAFLDAFGGTRFVLSLGKWIASRLVSGPAGVAVISSSLLGTITGSTVANIAITGAFTIPMMKKAGYRPEQAGAIEAVSSNGGQIMPPVMGAAAFVMAGYAGIPYVQIAAAAILPAFFYYFSTFLYVQLSAQKASVRSVVEPISGRQLLLEAPAFFIPLAVLTFLLARGYSLPFVGFWSVIALIAVGLLMSVIRKEGRLKAREVIESVTGGIVLGSEIAVSCALIGIVVACILVSGLGIMLPLLIQDISGGHVIVALAIASVSSLILGMGVPTTAAYILVAVGLVPALRQMGVPLLQAHFFPFMFACFSHITPPVAYGVLVASRLAGAEYWKTAWEAVKASFVAFFLPFFVVYAPVVVLKPLDNIYLAISKLAAILLCIVSVQIAGANYCLVPLKRIERIAYFVSGSLWMIFVFTRLQALLVAAGILFAMSTAWQFGRRRRQLKSVAT